MFEEHPPSVQMSSDDYKKATEELYKQNLEVVRLYKQVEHLNQQLQEANDGQSNLLHILNHQIKGYLAKSRNIFAELMNDPEYGACTAEASPLLLEGFNSLTDGVMFVTDFLNSANVQDGTYEYVRIDFDLRAIVEEQFKPLEPVAAKKGLSYELKVEKGDYKMSGDKMQIGQAVRNLIENSILYTPKGGLKVKLERKADKMLFSVSDTGVGLSEDVKPKLFTKGGRDKNSMKINVNSTGFGLAFVKGVAEAHKGRVWAESEGQGKGSQFYLELPLS